MIGGIIGKETMFILYSQYEIQVQGTNNFQVPLFIWFILGILLLAVILGLILGEKMSEDRLSPEMIPLTGNKPANKSDFILLHGIDQETQQALYRAGIKTFVELANFSVRDLREILLPRQIESYVLATWPDQAKLAAAGNWTELQDLQAQIRETAG